MSADRVQPTRSAASGSTTVYYRRPGVVVTSRQLSIGRYRYDVGQLAELMQARGDTHPGAMVAMVIALAEVPLVVLLVGVLRAPVAWLLAMLAFLIPCLVGVVCAQRWPAQYELLARYGGGQVTLFTSRDEREFGQVARAVRRAMEATPSDDTRP